ncbi:MAG: HlyC/CorC family transporter [Erysipelothrix sp.]|nr:HlyC/CorC family transporter [Erysipelothrix sp.]
MDDQRFQLLLLAIISLILLSFVSLIQNSLNLVSETRLNNLALAGEEKANKIASHLDHQTKTFVSIKILKTILSLMIAFCVLPFTKTVHWLILFVIVIIIQLIVTEILPLTLSKVNPERLLVKLQPLVSMLLFVVLPIYWFLNLFIKLFSFFFKPQVENVITEQELLSIVEEAQSEGTLQQSEGDLIRRSIEFNDLIVEEILTPRVDLVAVDINWPLQKIADLITYNEFSRYPVYQESLDKIIGVIHSKDFRNYTDETFDLRSIINPVLFVPESYKISKLLKQLQQSKNHLAVVIDEYGGTAGIVTLEDIVEELVGEIWDEHDDIYDDIQQVNQNQYVVLGSTELTRLFEILDKEQDTDEMDATTVGGWVIEMMNKIPLISETVTVDNYVLTVLDADEKRVHKVLIELIKKKEEIDNEETNTD